jgi:hypothetical protein
MAQVLTAIGDYKEAEVVSLWCFSVRKNRFPKGSYERLLGVHKYAIFSATLSTQHYEPSTEIDLLVSAELNENYVFDKNSTLMTLTI